MNMTKSRPVGITVLAAMLAIQGFFELVYGILLLVRVPGIVVVSGNTVVMVQVYPWGFLISGILALILAYGLWTLQIWAFWTTVILEALNLIGGILQLFTTNSIVAILLSMVIPAVILIYFLTDKHVNRAFHTPELHSPERN